MRRNTAVILLGATLGVSALAIGDGPGLPNMPYAPEDLFQTLSLIEYDQGIVAVAMHKGYLFVPFAVDEADPEGGFAMWDVSDPFDPVEVLHIQDADSNELREPQGFAFLKQGEEYYVALQAKRGVQIWNMTDPLAPFRASYIDLGVNGFSGAGIWWVAAQGSTVYAGGQNDGLFVIDALDPSDPQLIAHVANEDMGGVVVCGVYPLGNKLAVAACFNRVGYALADISDPAQPLLLGAAVGDDMPVNHGANFNGRFMFGAGSDFALHIHRVSPSGTFTELANLPTDGKGGFVTSQDRFVHFGASFTYHKILVANPSNPIIVGDADPGVGDWDYGTPLGNLVLIAADNTGTGAIVVHQLPPDNRAPRIVSVNPRNNAPNQALTSSVGVALSDHIDLRSVDSGSFAVSPVGGQPLEGTYSHAFGIINFSPAEALEPNTTYEITLTAGGVADYVGNALTSTFVSQFTTASR